MSKHLAAPAYYADLDAEHAAAWYRGMGAGRAAGIFPKEGPAYPRHRKPEWAVTLDAELEAVGLPRTNRNCRCTVDPALVSILAEKGVEL